MAGAFAASYELAEREALLCLLVAVSVAPLLVRAAHGRLDTFEPLFLIAAAVLVLFAVRPVAHLVSGEMFYRGFGLEPGFDRALQIAAVGVVATVVGYELSWGRAWASRFPAFGSEWDTRRATWFALALTGLGLILFAVFLSRANGVATAADLLAGRSYDQDQIYRNASAVLYFGPYLAIPATLILIECAARGQRHALLLSMLVGATVVLVTGPRGDRIWLLTFLLSVVVLYYLRRGRRPGPARLLVGALLVVLFGVAFIREVRTPVEREGDPVSVLVTTATDPGETLTEVALGPDIEMFSVLAAEAQVVPELRPFEPGATLASAAASLVPRELWATKPVPPDARINAALFPAQTRISTAGTAPSLFGGLWWDGGFAAVILGGGLFGLIARTLWEYYRRDPEGAITRLIFAVSLPLVLILLRGNPADTIPRALYLLGPMVLFGLLGRGWLRERT